MQVISQICFLGCLIVLAQTATPPPINLSDQQIETTLSDKRYIGRLLKCALGEGPCDPVGRSIKSFAPLVLRGNCPQCSQERTRQIQKVLVYVQKNYPKEWNKLVQQYAG